MTPSHVPTPSAPRRGFNPQRFAACLALLWVAACSSAPDKRTLQYLNQEGFGKRYVGNAEEEEYVSIGDTVEIEDLLHPDEISGIQTVRTDGRILLPELGDVSVAGYTRSELQAILTERYSLYYDETEIVVDISSEGQSFWVLGEVRDKGRKEFIGNQTVFEAVWDAEPFRSSANVGRCLLIRGDARDPLILPFNLDDLTVNGEMSTNYQIRENDIIYVPPTLLAELGYFFEAVLYPVTIVIESVTGAFFDSGYGYGNTNRAAGYGSVF
jgi:protein involved in polysaccharide export with SLBB domain